MTTSMTSSTSSITSPAKSPDDDGSQRWMEWKQQLQAYVAWVNSQLKKKPGVRLVEDLRNDCKDGVVLIELIDIVAKEKLENVHMVPSSYTEMRENVERVLYFMTSNRIRMHHTSAKDIVEGNLKAIMRLILALAAHFKPQSVRHSSHHYPASSGTPNTTTGIAQGAVAALAEARRSVARAGSIRGNRGRYADRRKTYHGSSSDQCSDSDHSFGCHDTQQRSLRGRDEGDGASTDKSPLSSARYGASPLSGASNSVSSHRSAAPLSKSRSTDHISSKDSGTELEDSGSTVVDRGQYEDLLLEYNELSTAMRTTKDTLMKLQDLLLSGNPPDGEESKEREIIESSFPAEQMVILKSQLVQSSEKNKDLQEELSYTRNECITLQGTRSGLNQRLMEQDELISQLKSDILQRDFQIQHSDSEKNEFQKVLKEKEKTIMDLRKDLARRDHRIDQLQFDLQQERAEKERAVEGLKAHIATLHDKLQLVGQTEANLSAKVASQDKRMARLEGRIMSTSSDSNSARSEPRYASHTGGEELHVVRDSLHSLRLSFKNTDPQQHTLDTLEQSVSMLLEKIHLTNGSHSSASSQAGSDKATSRRLNFDSTGDVRRSPITQHIPNLHQSHISYNNHNHVNDTGQPLPSAPVTSTPLSNKNSTKVLYFSDKALSPFSCTIHKRLGDITLRDFKEMYDRPGKYRYSFKALDPEFGTVKEEIMRDEDVIPGWEGKIVAWIEEDTG